MPNLFEVRDQNGIKIYCTEEQWKSHIALNHSIMERNIDAIVETIREPEIVLPSHDTDPPLNDRRIYTKESKVATYHPKLKYTNVIISVCGGSGEVVTAYPNNNKTSGYSEGEAIYIAEE